jgi:hypothetical protein
VGHDSSLLLRSEDISTPDALLCLGIAVGGASLLAFLVRFSPEQENAAEEEMGLRLLSLEAPGDAGRSSPPARRYFAEAASWCAAMRAGASGLS